MLCYIICRFYRNETKIVSKQKQLNLAILGGGQLGMLLCEAARKLEINTVIVTPDAEGPAMATAASSIITDMTSDGLAGRLAGVADVVTYELEDIPASLLEELISEQEAGNIKVHPAAQLLGLLKNKATQKQWYLDHGFPTLPFLIEESPVNVKSDLPQFGLPLVQKAQTGGYDGYGVQVIREEAELENLWDVPSMIEQYVDRPVELGVVVARSGKGEIINYQPVRMEFEQEKNILDAVILPTGLDKRIDDDAVELARAVIDSLEGVGVFAVEMFLVNDELLINEISPRVHNSGHHTLETSNVSQFEQHVRAVCDLPLVEPEKPAGSAIMANLLYSDDLEFLLGTPTGVKSSDDGDVHLYWYGKKEGRTGRKMGHVTCLGLNLQESKIRTGQFIEQLKQKSEGAVA